MPSSAEISTTVTAHLDIVRLRPTRSGTKISSRTFFEKLQLSSDTDTHVNCAPPCGEHEATQYDRMHVNLWLHLNLGHCP